MSHIIKPPTYNPYDDALMALNKLIIHVKLSQMDKDDPKVQKAFSFNPAPSNEELDRMFNQIREGLQIHAKELRKY